MGVLSRFDLGFLRAKHKLHSFVETGTGNGQAVTQAWQAGFEEIHSIEIDPAVAGIAKMRFQRIPYVHIHEGDSCELLEGILRALPDKPALFWLDAHFPGAELANKNYDAEQDAKRRLPLQTEMELIARLRNGMPDVTLADDARIYLDGPFTQGQIDPTWEPLKGIKRSIDFVRDCFGKTHGVVVDYADTGYMMVTPKLT